MAPIHPRHTLTLTLALALAVAGCKSPLSKTPATGAGSETTIKTGLKPTIIGKDLMNPSGTGLIAKDGGGLIAKDGGGLIAKDGAGLIARDGAGLIARDGAGLSGTVSMPLGLVARDGGGLIAKDGAGLIARDGAGLIARDGAGYRVAALPADVPVRKQLVYLMNAEQKLVVGADNQPITATTDDKGHFQFKGFTTTKNLFFAVKLYDDKGLLTAVVPRSDATARTVGVNLESTYTASYIQAQYLAKQADPVTVFERLPADLEAQTRVAVAKAAYKDGTVPANVTPSTVVSVVDRLRAADTATDAQFVEVKRVLLAGLSNQGAGLPADTLETEALDVAVSPSGEVVFAGSTTRRVWKKDAQGNLTVVAGTGFDSSTAAPTQGDGGPATAADLVPVAVAYAPDGALLIADEGARAIRRVGPDGTLSTIAASPLWTKLTDVIAEPDGKLLVATFSGIWRVAPGGTPTLIAGESRAFDANTWYFASPSGDGGSALLAKFRNILSIARDPRDGGIAIFDFGNRLRRIDGTTIDAIAGTAVPGFSGDGGDPKVAQVSPIGAIAYRPDGSLLIADSLNHRIREVASGTIATVAGNGDGRLSGNGGAALTAGLVNPLAITIGADGATYFADSGYVRRLSQGTVSAVIGGTRGYDTARPANEVQLQGPRGLFFDAAANTMLIEDTRRIWSWALGTNRITVAMGGGVGGAAFAEGQSATATNLNAPNVVQGATALDVLAADPITGLARLLRVTNGTLSKLAGGAAQVDASDSDGPANGAVMTGGYASPILLDGWYYYTLATFDHIRRLKPGGNTEKWGGYGTSTGHGGTALGHSFKSLRAFILGPDGQFYVGTESYIYRIDPAGSSVTLIAGNPSGTAALGQAAAQTRINGADGIAWDAAGQLYYSEREGGRVLRIRKDTGAVELVAGKGARNLGGNTVDTGLVNPTGLAFDGQGNLYVADSRHGQVKVIPKAQL